MHGIAIQKITTVNPADQRGATFELWKGLDGKQVTLYRREAGSVFGNHFHKGLDPAKDPEYFFLLSGEARLYAKNGLTNEEIDLVVGPEYSFSIAKNIWHRFEALTDVVFLEYRNEVFDPAESDCFPESEYESYIATLASN